MAGRSRLGGPTWGQVNHLRLPLFPEIPRLEEQVWCPCPFGPIHARSHVGAHCGLMSVLPGRVPRRELGTERALGTLMEHDAPCFVSSDNLVIGR